MERIPCTKLTHFSLQWFISPQLAIKCRRSQFQEWENTSIFIEDISQTSLIGLYTGCQVSSVHGTLTISFPVYNTEYRCKIHYYLSNGTNLKPVLFIHLPCTLHRCLDNFLRRSFLFSWCALFLVTAGSRECWSRWPLGPCSCQTLAARIGSDGPSPSSAGRGREGTGRQTRWTGWAMSSV